MERQGYYVIYCNAIEVKIRYHYKFQDSNLRVTFDGRDLADLLDITKKTLKDMHFEVYMEIEREDGRIEKTPVRLPDIIMISTSTELRQNHYLYARPYDMSFD